LIMQPFAFSRAATLDDAVAATVAGAFPIAGGTELLNWMKEGIVVPVRLVDISRLPALDTIKVDGDHLRIGALARMATVADDAAVKREFPALAQALEKSASQQIRNMATMGGNLLQRTRCPYFRADTALACNKRQPDSGCSAIGGEDRSLAIFGGSEQCIATHPSDAAVALSAFEAVVRVQGPKGTREIALADLHRLPGNTPAQETSLAPGELIVEIRVPRSQRSQRSSYLKIRERASYEFALVSAAAALSLDGDTIRDVRLALGGVAPKPWRLPNAEAALRGVSLRDVPAMRRTLERDFRAARGGRHNGFKIELAQRTVIRALQLAGGVA
jgi:xanthine dehydrogenase YagS FAD-binding subunit